MVEEVYRTANLNEIAILLASGKKYLSAEKEAGRIVFSFEGEGCKDLVQKYYNKEKIVPPFDFAESLRTAKDIIFSEERR